MRRLNNMKIRAAVIKGALVATTLFAAMGFTQSAYSGTVQEPMPSESHSLNLNIERDALQIALGHPEIKILTENRRFSVTESGYFPNPETVSDQIILSLLFDASFTYEQNEI